MDSSRTSGGIVSSRYKESPLIFLTTDFTAPGKWTVGQGQENRDICVDGRPFGCLVQALTDAVTAYLVQFTRTRIRVRKIVSDVTRP